MTEDLIDSYQERPALDVKKVDGFGVPTFWLPGEGATSAGLVYRAGRAVEPMALRGISRVIELAVNKAISARSGPAKQVLDTTTFSVTGDDHIIQSFLYSVSSALATVPLELVDEARATVVEEDASHTYGVSAELARLRHGYLGLGAAALADYGIKKSGYGQVLNWATRYFQKDNCALWITGPLPERVPLRLVGSGEVPRDKSSFPVPGRSSGFCEPGTIGLSFVGQYGFAMSAAVLIAGEHVRHQVGEQQHLLTEMSIKTNEFDTDRVEVVIVGKCAVGAEESALREVIQVLESLAGGALADNELEVAKARLLDQKCDPRNSTALVHGVAVGHLTRRRVATGSAAVETIGALNRDHVSSAFGDALRSLIVVAPESAAGIHKQFPPAESWKTDQFSGFSIKPLKQRGDKSRRELHVGLNGITLKEENETASVRFSECGLLLIHSANGSREYISTNGTTIFVSGADWEITETLMQKIDERIDPQSRVLVDAESNVSASGVERRRRSRGESPENSEY